MKNKRNKLANFFTIVVLLFGISLLLWNCETDNVMDSHYHVSKDVDYNLERLGYDDLIIDKEIEKSLPKIQQRFFKKNQSEYKSKNTLEVSEQFSIITDSVNKVSTKYIITWAFKIKKPVLKSSDFENFLIKKENDEFSYFLISYKRDKDDKYQEANLYPISEESLNVNNLNLKTDYIEEDPDGNGGGSGCPGRVIHLPCNNGDAYIHGPESFVEGGYCSGTTTILDFSDCFSYGGPESPNNDSNTTVPDNNNSQNNGGGSSSGGSVITSPVTLECDNCTSAQTVVSYLNLTDQNQIDWVNDTNNQQSVTYIENFGNANQWSQQAKNFALEAINILRDRSLSDNQKFERFKIADKIFDPYLSQNEPKEKYEAKIRHYAKNFKEWGNKEFGNYLESLLPLDSSYSQEDYNTLYNTIRNKKAQLFWDYIRAVVGTTAESFKPVIEMALWEVGGGLALKVLSKLPVRYLTKPIKDVITRLRAPSSTAFSNFKHAKKFGIEAFAKLEAKFVELGLTRTGQKVQFHHLIEQRFANTTGVKNWLGNSTNNWKSIVLTHKEHQVFTNAWRQRIGYGTTNGTSGFYTRNVPLSEIKKAAKEIYKNYPEILNALGL